MTQDIRKALEDTSATIALLLEITATGELTLEQRMLAAESCVRARAALASAPTEELPRIGSVGCSCKCGWRGVVDDMIPDIDGDGNLGCPKCLGLIQVMAPPAPTESCPACGTTVDEPTHDPTCPLVTRDQPAPTYSDEDVRRLVEAARWARIFLNVKDISAADAELKLALTKFPKEH